MYNNARSCVVLLEGDMRKPTPVDPVMVYQRQFDVAEQENVHRDSVVSGNPTTPDVKLSTAEETVPGWPI